MRGVLRTPHDWVMFIYYAYVVWNSPTFMGALIGFLSLLAFYLLTVQTLSDWDRILRYLRWWNGLLLAVSVIGLLSLIGVDLTGAGERTVFNAGRLALGTWLHNNPNALGHSVIVTLPLSYLLFFWKGGASGRFLIFPVFGVVALACVWQTQSKGAFLVGGVLCVLLFVIGRPKVVQVGAISLAAILGVGALSFLPRMESMDNLQSDQGVQGRLLAWEMARTVTRNQPTGTGWQTFVAYIDWKEGNVLHRDIPKATHSSYVQVGADLGIYGLFIYLLGLWVALRTLLRMKSENDEQERCRRGLLLLLIANLISGWMINRQYHTEYFLLIGTAAAMHRLYKVRQDQLLQEAEAARLEETAERGDAEVVDLGAVLSANPRVRPFWNRLDIWDLAAGVTMTWLTIEFWDYMLAKL
ncbi:MAG: O-antigen ligase family protein [Verrucomicrobiales bacterium]|nr:O-antigen ligase family protein [Verrucomicrobiales bacterium]